MALWEISLISSTCSTDRSILRAIASLHTATCKLFRTLEKNPAAYLVADFSSMYLFNTSTIVRPPIGVCSIYLNHRIERVRIRRVRRGRENRTERRIGRSGRELLYIHGKSARAKNSVTWVYQYTSPFLYSRRIPMAWSLSAGLSLERVVFSETLDVLTNKEA